MYALDIRICRDPWLPSSRPQPRLRLSFKPQARSMDLAEADERLRRLLADVEAACQHLPRQASISGHGG
ncbi:MAG: hypothetical protein JWN97_3624 [Nocardioides sp.]|nr:hypothetical protein [Nocardioides sp.]